MGLTSGPVTFQRFWATGSLPGDVDDAFLAAVQERAFGRLAPLSDDTQVGWIGPGHLFETEIVGHKVAYGAYALLAVRVDKLRVPPAVLKSYVRLEEEALLQASGKEFLSKGERRQAKDTAQIRAEQELRAGQHRSMSSYPVLIDLANQTVYLGGTSSNLADRFMALFLDTFGVGLEPADTERVAQRLMQPAGRSRSLENLPPAHLIRPPDGYEGGGADFAPGYLKFLGRELLTWLWYQTEAGDGPLRVTNGDSVTVALDKSLRLQCDFDLTGSDVITADNPTALPEAKAALRVGKQVTRAGMVLGSPLGEFRLTLDGLRFTVSGLQVPESQQGEEDHHARLEQRFELIADAATLLDALFEAFLLKRTSTRDWEMELRQMRSWIAGERTPKLVPSAASA